jgi:rRNA maturation endonuclease Nob1
MSLSINCSSSHAIPRFASQPRSKMFGPNLQMTMSATDIVAKKQVLCHSGVRSAGLVGHSSNQIALHIQYVGCSTGLSSAYTLYEPIIQDRVYPTSVRYADMRLVSTCLRQSYQRESCASCGSSMLRTVLQQDRDKDHATDSCKG